VRHGHRLLTAWSPYGLGGRDLRYPLVLISLLVASFFSLGCQATGIEAEEVTGIKELAVKGLNLSDEATAVGRVPVEEEGLLTAHRACRHGSG
jgi:hypothetical protein